MANGGEELPVGVVVGVTLGAALGAIVLVVTCGVLARYVLRWRKRAADAKCNL
jgi:hypothetical protein